FRGAGCAFYAVFLVAAYAESGKFGFDRRRLACLGEFPLAVVFGFAESLYQRYRIVRYADANRQAAGRGRTWYRPSGPLRQVGHGCAPDYDPRTLPGLS